MDTNYNTRTVLSRYTRPHYIPSSRTVHSMHPPPHSTLLSGACYMATPHHTLTVLRLFTHRLHPLYAHSYIRTTLYTYTPPSTQFSLTVHRAMCPHPPARAIHVLSGASQHGMATHHHHTRCTLSHYHITIITLRSTLYIDMMPPYTHCRDCTRLALYTRPLRSVLWPHPHHTPTAHSLFTPTLANL
jgi:hypothetical protein